MAENLVRCRSNGAARRERNARVRRLGAYALLGAGLTLLSACDQFSRQRDIAQEFVMMGSARYLGADCEGCPEMVAVPDGHFSMGSPRSEKGRWGDEGPMRIVSIQGFAVGKYEVTWDEWELCVKDGGCDPEGLEDAGGDEGWGRGRKPVINVTWEDTEGFVRWLSKKTGKNYRLLSEAEWEYAARAGTTSRFSWGSAEPICNRRFKNSANFWECDDKRTYLVGSFHANDFGLFDMHGNVWEWVADCYHASYRGAPTDGSPWIDDECKSSVLRKGARVIRGGSWDSWPRGLRSALRFKVDWDARNWFTGFRVARDLQPNER